MRNQAKPPHDPDDLPGIQRLLALALGAGLDLLQARHPQSWQQGWESGVQEIINREPALPAIAPVKITIGYADLVHHLPGRDEDVLSSERLPWPAELREVARAEFLACLPAGQQPTDEQWRSILATTSATVVTGGAGTGKTRTLILRALALHRYLRVPLQEIQMLVFDREARLDTAAELRRIFELFGLPITPQQSLQIVMTPRSALLAQAHSLADLQRLVPLEALGSAAGDIAAVADVAPFGSRLSSDQREELTKCLRDLFRSNRSFAELYLELWLDSLALAPLEVDTPEVVKRAPFGWKLADEDDDLCDAVEKVWRSAGAWPIDGIEVVRKPLVLRGRTYSTHGYIPQLQCSVLLGVDRAESPTLRRAGSTGLELFKEVAIKRTLVQAYAEERVVHLDTYADAQELVAALRLLDDQAPLFNYQLSGAGDSTGIVELFYTVAQLVGALGLEISSVPARLNFLRGDTTATFFEVLGLYWQHLERRLIKLPNQVIPFWRLFGFFGSTESPCLRHTPAVALERSRHLLVDTAEDLPYPVLNWLRAVLAEIRRRDLGQAAATGNFTSISVAGDCNQAVYGTVGASPKLLTDIESLLPSGCAPTRCDLSESFRSPASLLAAADNIVLGLAPKLPRTARAASAVPGPSQSIEIYGPDPQAIRRICDAAAEQSKQVLVLIDSAQDRAWVDSAIGDRIRQDRAIGGGRLRVRSFHKAKALEADLVLIVGDPSAAFCPWYRNQLFKLAGFGTGGDRTPGDSVSRGEVLRLIRAAIGRAREAVTWFIPNAPKGRSNTASGLALLSKDCFHDKR